MRSPTTVQRIDPLTDRRIVRRRRRNRLTVRLTDRTRNPTTVRRSGPQIVRRIARHRHRSLPSARHQHQRRNQLTVQRTAQRRRRNLRIARHRLSDLRRVNRIAKKKSHPRTKKKQPRTRKSLPRIKRRTSLRADTTLKNQTGETMRWLRPFFFLRSLSAQPEVRPMVRTLAARGTRQLQISCAALSV